MGEGKWKEKNYCCDSYMVPFLEEYLLPLSTLPSFDQHLILLFLTQYTGMGTWHHASDFLSVVLLPLKGYWNKVHREPSSLKSCKRLMVSFFSSERIFVVHLWQGSFLRILFVTALRLSYFIYNPSAMVCLSLLRREHRPIRILSWLALANKHMPSLAKTQKSLSLKSW